MVDKLWDMLKPSLESSPGKLLKLKDYFDVVSIPTNGSFIFGLVKFDLIQTIHIISGNSILDSYGLMINYMQKKLFITGDTVFSQLLLPYYQQADLIFQEVETEDYKSGVHCHIDDISKLDINLTKKMFLYHYNDNLLSGLFDLYRFRNFKGYLQPKQIVDLDTMRYGY